jgi:hypothetical protein
VNKVFVIGNGESRKGVDLDRLQQHGKVYGCNALYRDFTPDALVCVDSAMIHEVYSSGYCSDNKAYFRAWNKLPAYIYSDMVNLDSMMDWPMGVFNSNERGDKTEFVLHGTDPNQIHAYYEKLVQKHQIKDDSEKERIRQLMGKHGMWVTWVENKDWASSIPMGIEGWSAGPIAVNLACLLEEPKDVYLIGFDMDSKDGLVNNVYKGTDNYVSSDSPETLNINWLRQHKQNFEWFPNVNFWKVGSKPLEWDGIDNLKFLEKPLDF